MSESTRRRSFDWIAAGAILGSLGVALAIVYGIGLLLLAVL